MEMLCEASIEAGITIRASAITNCPAGGDAGHGGFVEIELENENGVPFEITVSPGGQCLRIKAGGDWEADALTKAFRFIASSLELQQMQNENDARENAL